MKMPRFGQVSWSFLWWLFTSDVFLLQKSTRIIELELYKLGVATSQQVANEGFTRNPLSKNRIKGQTQGIRSAL